MKTHPPQFGLPDDYDPEEPEWFKPSSPELLKRAAEIRALAEQTRAAYERRQQTFSAGRNIKAPSSKVTK